MTDSVDQIVEAWKVRVPDADLSGLELNRRLFLAHRAVVTYSAAVLAESKLDIWEWDVMFVLWQTAPAEMTMGDLGAQLFITAGSVTNRVRQLEKCTLVARRPDPSNQRRVLVRLTDEGMHAAEAAAPHFASASAHVSAQLTARGVDVGQLSAALALVTPPLDLPTSTTQEKQ